MRTRSQFYAVLTLITVVSQSAADDGVNFNRDIRPILSDKCFACHGLDKNARKADLRLDQRENAIELKVIVPGRPQESSLIERVFSTDADAVMPPPKFNKPLTEEQKDLLRKWIAEGAEYHPHWSFIPVPKVIPVPRPNDPSGWMRTPIDAFVLERLQKEHQLPATEVSREKWLRRASFDLTGLPPSLTELDTFLSDQSTNAYELAADRLLRSSAFGERMANMWLDVARYADTFGYQADRDMHMWPWRDWVIRAFNDNLPYDQFIQWQTAGDLLPNATRDQRLATAFNRLHRQTNEGGSTEEEFRQAYIADRVVTNGTAFLGVTLDCSRCHDHKYDPILQADFYKLAAFFTSIDEHGLYSHFTETAPTPAMLLFEGDQQTRHSELQARLRSKEQDLLRIRGEAKDRFGTSPLAKMEISDLKSLSEAISSGGAATIEPKLRLNFDEAKVSGENRLVPGLHGQAIEFSGDDAFACTGSGEYGRTSPFSISLWVKPAEYRARELVLHQCLAAEDAAYRGYSLILDNGQVQFSLIHFWPGNAIRVQAAQPIPVNEWTHLGISYDGSSRASGVRLYVNGTPIAASVVRDQLTRDIKYRKEWGDSGGTEMALGARMRDVGFRHGAVDELLVYDRELSSIEIAKLYLEQAPATTSADQKSLKISDEARFEHYLLRLDEPYRTALEEIQKLRNEENELVSQVRQIMVLEESKEPRPTHILKRGAYDAPGETVTEDTPSSILPFPKEFPRNRLGLAKWLTDDRNPLPSRVAVNRFWSLFFGRGIVLSLEDFGGQGQLPSHPELLDWLARDFMDHGWNVKALCKQIILSATYRQSTIPRNPKLMSDDPDNVLLARGPRYRLPAEQVRDNVLAASELLVATVGGPSVKPYQPVGLWEESGTGKTYTQSKGEGLYRRSMYTFWRRTSPPPSMVAFDAPGREVCTARREQTATPLQALVVMNDPQFIEAARVLAEKLIKESNSTVETRIQTAFRRLTSRLPSEREREILIKLYADQKQHFESAPEDAKLFLTVGDAPRDETLNQADHAALAVTIQAIMSFDECVIKR